MWQGVWAIFLKALTMLFLIAFAQFSPSLAAIILVANRLGWQGLKSFLRRGIQMPKTRVWLLLAVLVPFLLVAVSIFIILLTSLPKPDFETLSPALVLPYFGVSLITGLLFGGISEEFGWRGYVLSLLQAKHSALVSGLIVGLMWGVWHLDPETMLVPLFTEGFGDFLAAVGQGYGIRLISDIATAVLMVWVFNETEGSLLTAIVFHSALNAAQTAAVAMWQDFPLAGELIYYGFKWLLIMVLLVWLGEKTLSRARVQSNAQRPEDVVRLGTIKHAA